MFSDPSFWLAVSFFIFVGLMAKYVFPFLTKAMDNKSKQIADDIEAAKQMREKAEELLALAEKNQQESMDYCKKLADDASKEADKLLAESRKSLEDEISKKVNLAKERIAQEEENVIRDIKHNIVTSAIKAIEDKAANLSSKSADDISKKSISRISKMVH